MRPNNQRAPGRAVVVEASGGRSFSQDLGPHTANRDLRQLLWHRHRLVQMRTRVMNQLHVVALNEGLRRKKALWRPAGRNELESLKLAALGEPTTPRLARLTGSTDAEDPGSDAPTEQEVERRPVTRRPTTHPGVGPLTALAYELVVGTPNVFTAANRSPATWGWFRRKSPAAIGVDWDTSVSRAMCCSGFCWWKRRRSRCAAIQSGAAHSSTWPCAEDGRSRR